MKKLFIASLMLIALTVTAKQPTPEVVKLKDKIALLEAKVSSMGIRDSTLASENEKLKETAAQLDSTKQEAIEFWEKNKPAEKPNSAGGWIWLILGVGLKFVGTPMFASWVSRYLKIRTNLGEVFADLKGDNAGFWIVAIVCLVLGLGVEAFFTGNLVDFNFIHSLKNSAVFFAIANLFYHAKGLVKKTA